MSIYINGYTRKKVLNAIKKKTLLKPCKNMGTCFYRGSDGNKCLIGVFIPDDKYTVRMEYCTKTVIETYMLERFMPMNTDRMYKLQRFHDSYLNNDKYYLKDIENKLVEMEKRDE